MRNLSKSRAVRRAWTGAPSGEEPEFPRRAKFIWLAGQVQATEVSHDKTRTARGSMALVEEQSAAKGKVGGAGGGQRRLQGEAGSEQNRAIERDSIAAAAIFASFHYTSCPLLSDQMLRCRWMTGESANLPAYRRMFNAVLWRYGKSAEGTQTLADIRGPASGGTPSIFLERYMFTRYHRGTPAN
jgi:hypothetical protein